MKAHTILGIRFALFSLTASFISCTPQAPKEPERVTLGYEVITDSIFTRMPGTVLKCGGYAVWEDPSAQNNYLHVVNATDGTEQVYGTKGQGPEEFSTPFISPSVDGRVLVSDLNSPRQALLTLSPQITKEQLPSDEAFNGATRHIVLENGEKLTHFPGNEKPFTLIQKGQTTTFGKLPLTLPQGVGRTYDYFQGNIIYSPARRLLVYSVMSFRYMAFYEHKADGTFALSREVTEPVDYQIVDNELRLDKPGLNGLPELVGTKDYLVSVERDPLAPKVERKGRDGSHLPKTLFVYNYEGVLLKIVDIGVPLFRLAGNDNDNVVYAMAVNPEFSLVRIDLDKL